jgi:hypothetical protein
MRKIPPTSPTCEYTFFHECPFISFWPSRARFLELLARFRTLLQTRADGRLVRTVGGLPFMVVIDTGSSDLWVQSNTSIPGSQSTGQSANISYAVGSAAGPIKLAEVTFAGCTIPNQAYLEVPAGNGVPGTQGIIGLGPASGSNILDTLSTAAFATAPVNVTQALGMAPPLDRIFANGSVPAFITSTWVVSA